MAASVLKKEKNKTSSLGPTMDEEERYENRNGPKGTFLPTEDEESDGGKEKSILALCRDKRYRGKLIYSFFLSCGLFCVQMVETQPGATFLDLQIITRTEFEKASRYFTVHTAGYLCGCILSGIVPKKVPRRPFMAISLLAMGATAIATPFCSHYSSMMVIRWASGIPPAILESVMFTEQMRIWGQEGKPVTQLVMLFSSIGQILSPIVSEPFLATRRNRTDHELFLNGTKQTFQSSDEEIQLNLNVSSNLNMSEEKYHTDAEYTYPSTNVLYAFLISGGLTILTSSLFLPFPCNNKYTQSNSGHSDGKNEKTSRVIQYRSVPLPVKVGLTIGISAFYLFYSVLTVSGSSFLMTFLINEFDHMTKSESAYILTLFLSCGIVSRALLVFLTERFSAQSMLGVFVVSIFTTFALFTVSAKFGQTTILIILVGMISTALSPILPLILSWSQTYYLQITSRVTSCILFSAASGAMLNPLLLSYLMQEKSNLWFCYLHTIHAFIPMVIFVILLLVNRYHVNRKYGPLKIAELNLDRKEIQKTSRKRSTD